MKIILALFLISSFGVKAQIYDATLYFLDGSKRTGKADVVSNDEPKLLFVENGSKKKEKIKITLLDKVEYINPKNNLPVTVELKEYVYYFMSDKPKTNSAWMRKISSGEISMYEAYSFDGGVSNGYHYTVTPSEMINIFFKFKDEKPQLIYFNNNMWTPNKKQILKRQIKNFFKDKCPKLVSDFDDEKLEIKNNNPEILIEYYEKNCSK